MLVPALINIPNFYYPTGNTAAVSLTRNLPPDRKADVLLLGCGDARHVLFTTFSEGKYSNRPIDVTCCDQEPAILARNILLYSLLLDDIDGGSSELIWNIYYHACLDEASTELLDIQASKLYRLSETETTWRDGEYGRYIFFCDNRTLVSLRSLWGFWTISKLSEEGLKAHRTQCENSLKKAKAYQKYRISDAGAVVSSYKSAIPAISQEIFTDIHELYKRYWSEGIIYPSNKKPKHMPRIPNPTFVPMIEDKNLLHYGTDPLHGFHLSTAFTPLTIDSPLRPEKMNAEGGKGKCVVAAQQQFKAWGDAFRDFASKKVISLRFFAGDAIALCYSLQHVASTLNSHFYCSQYSMDPLKLNHSEYGSKKAPTSFTMIDTSNIADHLGLLNVLVAAVPLLQHTAVATLATEVSFKGDKGVQDQLDRILCGHFATISLLLGVFPVEYWTNLQPSANIDLMSAAIKGYQQSWTGQLNWKRSLPSLCDTNPGGHSIKLSVDPQKISTVLFDLYKEMFMSENVNDMLLNMLSRMNDMKQSPRYNRISIVMIIGAIKSCVNSDWKDISTRFLRLVEEDTTLGLGTNFIQELNLHLHLYSLGTINTWKRFFQQVNTITCSNSLTKWDDIPHFVAVTLKVPRQSLKLITDQDTRYIGTPGVIADIKSQLDSPNEGTHDMFGALQLCFGTLKMSGERNTNDFRLNITTDEEGWNGDSDLFVSFYVPTHILLHDAKTLWVGLSLRPTVQTLSLFSKSLGKELSIYEANLSQSDRVFITKFPPNQTAYHSLFSSSQHLESEVHNCEGDDCESNEASPRFTVNAELDAATHRIWKLTSVVKIRSAALSKALKDGAAVTMVENAPLATTITISGADVEALLSLGFPCPVDLNRLVLRIHRKSSYIEASAPVIDRADVTALPDFIYPLAVERYAIVSWNSHYLDLDVLPAVDAKMTHKYNWLERHLNLQLSQREKTCRDGQEEPLGEDLRLNFKSTIYTMMLHLNGFFKPPARIFAFEYPNDQGVQMLVFVNKMRLDLGNRTVVLDVAVLPLITTLIDFITPFLEKYHEDILLIPMDQVEARLWKELLPAMVERCRYWSHKPTCLYWQKSRIPLSTLDGEPCVCGCGMGIFPPDFMAGLPDWDLVSRFATRAAISPLFFCPLVEA